MTRAARRAVLLVTGLVWALALTASGCFNLREDLAQCRDSGHCERPDGGPANPFCSGHWCWENPLPQGNDLLAVWTFSPNDVWAAGRVGTLMHWDGAAWTSYSGTLGDEDLTKLWGFAPKDLWVIGNQGLRARWDGSSWTKHPLPVAPELQALAGSDGGELWALGKDYASQWTGTEWVPSSDPFGVTFFGAWNAGPGQWWAFDDGNHLWELNAGRWTMTGFTAGNRLYDLWSSSPTDLWLVGDNNSIYRNTGGGWSLATSDMSGLSYGAVWGSGSTVWTGGQDGKILVRASSSPTAPAEEFAWPGSDPNSEWRDLWGTSPDNLWAAGTNGAIAHRTGGTWKLAAGGVAWDLSEVASSGERTFAVGDCGTILTPSNGGWVRATLGLPCQDLRDLWMTSSGKTWAVGDRIAAELQGDTWSYVLFATARFEGIWGSTSGDFWAVTQAGEVWHLDTSGWTAKTNFTGRTLTDVWGTDSGDLWVVGSAGTIYHLAPAASGWTEETLSTVTPVTLYGLSGSSAEDVWAVGESGTVLHRTASGWASDVPPGAGDTFLDAWSAGPGDVWVLGARSVWHHTPAGWTEEPLSITSEMLGIRGGGPGGALWAVGRLGTILRRQ